MSNLQPDSPLSSKERSFRVIPALGAESVVAQTYQSGTGVWISMPAAAVTVEDARRLRDWLNKALPDETPQPDSNQRLTHEKLAEYRDLLPMGRFVGVGGDALKVLLDEIDRLRPMAESWESYEAAQERKAEMRLGDETAARPVFNHERNCGLTNVASTCECPQSPVETTPAQKHYPEEWGPSDARRLSCVCGDPDPGHMSRGAAEAADAHAELKRLRKQMGVIAVLLLQNDRDEVMEWARGVKLTFKEGDPELVAEETPETLEELIAQSCDECGFIGHTHKPTCSRSTAKATGAPEGADVRSTLDDIYRSLCAAWDNRTLPASVLSADQFTRMREALDIPFPGYCKPGSPPNGSDKPE